MRYRIASSRIGSGRLNEQNRGRRGSRPAWSAVLLAVAIVTGCQATLAQRPHGARLLTAAEMDTVTAGSAVAASDAAARARGTEAQTDVLGSASAYSGLDPIPGPTFLNYANSQATASASGDALVATGLTSSVSVDGANGG